MLCKVILILYFCIVMNDILEGLNKAQREAVEYTDGPSLIVAGAGSGKTRVLTCRIANLLQKGAKPWEILALTFTRKAADEMKERIAQLVGDQSARRIWMGTFHAIFIRFLREFADQLGYPPQFTIYDQTDSRGVIRHCIKELNLDEKTYKPAVIQSRISLAKNNLKTVAGYRNDSAVMTEDREAHRPRTGDIYALYSAKCKAAGAMDFDDILLNTNILLRDFPEARQTIAARFKYILVDEYQDTNYSQYVILKKLAAGHRNISVVGDDSQSIYGFRGARIENILRFRKDYPEAREFRLEQNYRSTQTIVEAANSLIANNSNRIKKECYSLGDKGDKIGVIKGFTEQEEATLIASSIIERIYADKASYDSFAILYRTNAQSRAFEDAFRRKNLPYRIYGGHSFYERAEIKDMLAYFKLVINSKDDESLRRIINVPARGIGETTLERLAATANAEGCSMFEAIWLPAEKLAPAGLRDASVRKLKDFATMISTIAQKAETVNAYDVAVECGNLSGYLVSLKGDTSLEGQTRFENVEELFNGIKEYVEEETEMRRELAEEAPEGEEGGMAVLYGETVTLGDYLENIYLLTEAEKDDLMEDGSSSTNRITLMTVHASKGLEFPYVYIAGMEENLFPSDSMVGSPADIEEERRLFYVALTRAQKCATVSFARSRMRWGTPVSNNPSRFLREIDRRYLAEEIDARGATPHSMEEFLTDRNNGGYYGRSRQQSGYGSSQGYQKPTPSYGRTQQTSRPVQVQPTRPAVSGNYVHTPSAGFTPDPIVDLRVGQRVEHERFGFGKILSFSDEGPGMKAVVDFDKSGQKTLLLKFARLRIAR